MTLDEFTALNGALYTENDGTTIKLDITGVSVRGGKVEKIYAACKNPRITEFIIRPDKIGTVYHAENIYAS